MKELSRLLTLCVLICCLLPIHNSFAVDYEYIDHDNDGINIDDIVYHVSHSESSVDSNIIKYYMDRVAPVNSIPTADHIAEGISTVIAPSPDETLLTLPYVPNGYHIAIYESSSSVVGLDGRIEPPLVSVTIDLIFTVTRIYDNSSANTGSITVTVPAQSTTVPPQQVLIASGTVAASHNSGGNEGMEFAFDGDVDTKWFVNAKPIEGWWIQNQLNEPHIVKKYTVSSANDSESRDPKNWTFKGSNDGLVWTILDERVEENFPSRKQTNTYTFSNNTSYLYYRLDISQNAGGGEMQISELGLFGTPAPAPSAPIEDMNLPSSDINVALGGTVSASSTHGGGFPISSINNGDRTGAPWGNGGGWNDANSNEFPDWIVIHFGGSQTIHEIDVITIQDAYTSPVEPTSDLTFSSHGITNYIVQYWFGDSNNGYWVTVPNGIVASNDKVWRKFTFAPVATTQIRVLITKAADGHSRLVELEAWTSSVN
jgi:hypothetical protein